jgi:hypothetical protein
MSATIDDLLGVIGENEQRNLKCNILRCNKLVVNNGVYINNVESLTGSASTQAISITCPVTRIATTNTGSANQFTLAAGQEGQEKTIIVTAIATQNAQINVTNWYYGSSANNNMVFDGAGDAVTLIYLNSKWYLKAGSNAVTLN